MGKVIPVLFYALALLVFVGLIPLATNLEEVVLFIVPEPGIALKFGLSITIFLVANLFMFMFFFLGGGWRPWKRTQDDMSDEALE